MIGACGPTVTRHRLFRLGVIHLFWIALSVRDTVVLDIEFLRHSCPLIQGPAGVSATEILRSTGEGRPTDIPSSRAECKTGLRPGFWARPPRASEVLKDCSARDPIDNCRGLRSRLYKRLRRSPRYPAGKWPPRRLHRPVCRSEGLTGGDISPADRLGPTLVDGSGSARD